MSHKEVWVMLVIYTYIIIYNSMKELQINWLFVIKISLSRKRETSRDRHLLTNGIYGLNIWEFHNALLNGKHNETLISQMLVSVFAKMQTSVDLKTTDIATSLQILKYRFLVYNMKF